MKAGALLLLLALSPLPARAIVVDPCTVIAVEMMDSVSSEDARPGDFFRFETVNAVTSGNRIVIPALTEGEGIVVVAAPAGRQSRPGVLILDPLYLILPNGHHVGVVLNHNTDSLQKNGSSYSVPGYLGAIPLPGIGVAIGAFNYFHKGKNIEVPRGTVFTIFPSDDPNVENCQDHPNI